MENTNNLNTASKSNLSLTARTNLSVSGIKKIKSTEPSKVIAVLDNCAIIISGANLSVQNVSLSTGVLELSGLVTCIQYTNSGKRKFSLKNIFK